MHSTPFNFTSVAPAVTAEIELLAPAKNADIGIEAVNHGADAIYIGGPAFGARASAGNESGRHRAPHAPRAPLRRQGVHHAQHHPARRRARRRAPDGLAGVRGRCRRADRAGHGPADARPAADPAARQHADRHPHAREGQVPPGRRLLADGAGARARPAPDPRDRRRHAQRHAGVLHPRRAVRGLQRPVLPEPRAHRPQRQPRRLLAALPPALHRHRRQGRHRGARQPRAVDEGQQPDGQPRHAGGRGHPQLQDRGPLQGHGLREEHHRPLPPPARRDAGAPPRAARVVGRQGDVQLHARSRPQLQPRVHRLLRHRPQDGHRRVRHAQARGPVHRPRHQGGGRPLRGRARRRRHAC